MTSAAAETIACPFCGLLCDDLLFASGRVDTRGCAKAAAGFAREGAAREHRIAGGTASLAAAASAAAKILTEARLPLFSGLGADLAGLRALLALADRAGAVVDRWQSGAQWRNLAVMQDTGAFNATFAEVANRADVILLVGRDPARDYPRLAERLLRNRKPLYRASPPFVAYLGPDAIADPAISERIVLPAGRLFDALAMLGALVAARRIAAPAIEGVPLATFAALAERLKSARYGAILWDAAAFPPESGESAVRVILDLLRRLNRKTRAAGLPLGGSDHAQGAAQVMLWQAGWPGRLSFARGVPEHDPWLHDAERLLASGEADALLWTAALTPAPPPARAIPTIALVAADVALAQEPAVTIRVGIPGRHHAGTAVRADTVVALPLAAPHPDTLPSVAAAAAAILAAMPAAAA